jgi:hypothetical protein
MHRASKRGCPSLAAIRELRSTPTIFERCSAMAIQRTSGRSSGEHPW